MKNYYGIICSISSFIFNVLLQMVENNPVRDFYYRQPDAKTLYTSKPDHYFDIYWRHFQRYQNRPINILELGVREGGSLQMFREIFPQAKIVGIDVQRKCKLLEIDNDFKIYIGSVDDQKFLKNVCEKEGPFDIIVDDCSHQWKHQLIALQTLFPYLNNDDGCYLIEDISHWETVQFVCQQIVPNTVRIGIKRPNPENMWELVDTVHFYPIVIILDKRPYKKRFGKEKGEVTFWEFEDPKEKMRTFKLEIEAAQKKNNK